jgi:poly(3-hydroxybutyrate) depolymerase
MVGAGISNTGRRRGASRLAASLAVAVAATVASVAAPSPAHAYPADLGSGIVHDLNYTWSFPATSGGRGSSGTYDYLAYTPTGWTASESLPMYVVLHGCPAKDGQGAQAMMEATRLNALADEERFVVLYAANGARCWRASSPGRSNAIRGGGGDADIVAGMTRQTMSTFNVDTERVYILGFSSGGSQASATGYAYPDIYPGVGTDAASGPSMDTTCNAMNDATARSFAESTVQQMGTRARAVPFFAIGGDGILGGQEDPVGWVDSTGTLPKVSGCTRIAYLTALEIGKLVTPGAGPDDFKTSITETGAITQAEDGTPLAGVPWKRQVALDPSGCPIAENWITGTGHKWMGGSTDPAYAHWGINDPRAPSTGRNSWNFFKQFTLSGGNTACNPSPSAEANTVRGNRPGHYRANTSASLFEAKAVQLPGQQTASHVTVAPVSATVDSAVKGAAPKASADARSLTAEGLGAGLDKTYGVEARQSAPPGNTSPVHQQSAAVPAYPHFNADVATADAHARWGSRSECITEGPIAQARSTLVDAQYQPDGSSDEGSGWHGDGIGMTDYVAQRGTGTSTGVVQLTPRASDDRYSLNATATTQVSGIHVAAALYVGVVAPAAAEVVATGLPGTAAVAVNQPVLRVQGATLASGRTFTTKIDGGQVVQITPGLVTKKVSGDGTTASASGILAHIKILDPTGTAVLSDVTVGNIAATATVPLGGVICKGGSDIASVEDDAPTAAAAEPGQGGTAADGSDPGAAARPAQSRVTLAASARPALETVAFPLLLLVGVLGALGMRRRRRHVRAR